VTVGSRKVIVGYEYDLKHDAVDPTNGWLGLRESGNGSIDFLSDSPETAFAEKEQIVFRVADLYLSTESVDLKQNRVVLLSHPAADYLRIELQRGAVLPDWNFVDLAGRPGSLKSYVGKYVMLDVWTASCGWCLEEFATLKSAVQRFGSRNFEILGVLGDQDEVEARKAEEQHGLPWRTAASGSTFEYAQRRLRIASWPTHILLDPDGRIISASSSELRDEALLKTLQALLSH
jgi:peroxiredoxin